MIVNGPSRARGLTRLAAALLAVALLGACDDGAPADAGRLDAQLVLGCPSWVDPTAMPGDPIDGDTYATFAAPLFDQYCTRCHASTLVGEDARSFAPEGLNWDDEAAVRANLDRIRVAIGVQNFMPPDAPNPTCEERRRLVRWIDAAAP